MLGIKQELQGLIMPAKAVVQNQQEVSVVVGRRLKASVYGGMAVDKNDYRECPINRVLHPLLPLGLVQTLLRLQVHHVKMYPMTG